MKAFVIACLFALAGCAQVPAGIEPVNDFDVQRYLGKWYEIARLDHSFERGMSDVTAEYSLRGDGGVKVLNRGFLQDKNEWREAEGKARFVDGETKGFLEVSFFGPFYGSYVVFELDRANYEYAVVAGPDRSYLWILARKPAIEKPLLERLVASARAKGFDTDKLIYVDHQRNSAARAAK